MTRLGFYLLFFGIGSIILKSYGYDFRILSWLGEGNTSRIVIASIGLLLVIFGSVGSKNETEGKSE